jgi:hypothetical protein
VRVVAVVAAVVVYDLGRLTGSRFVVVVVVAGWPGVWLGTVAVAAGGVAVDDMGPAA